MLSHTLAQTSVVAKLGLLVGLAPLVLGMLYAIRPSERRLALMRPISLAAIFAAICTMIVGMVGVITSLAASPDLASSDVQRALPGLAEALVPVFVTFACLTVAWLCVALGMRRTESAP
jgi:hypothetical protein